METQSVWGLPVSMEAVRAKEDEAKNDPACQRAGYFAVYHYHPVFDRFFGECPPTSTFSYVTIRNEDQYVEALSLFYRDIAGLSGLVRQPVRNLYIISVWRIQKEIWVCVKANYELEKQEAVVEILVQQSVDLLVTPEAQRDNAQVDAYWLLRTGKAEVVPMLSTRTGKNGETEAFVMGFSICLKE